MSKFKRLKIESSKLGERFYACFGRFQAIWGPRISDARGRLAKERIKSDGYMYFPFLVIQSPYYSPVIVCFDRTFILF